MKNISEWLREARDKSGKPVPEVSEELKKLNIIKSPKTIYGYESGHSMPDAYTLLALCKIYGVNDILSDMGFKPGISWEMSTPDMPLTPQEIEHIKKHRSLTFKSQVTVLDLIVHLYDIEHREEHAAHQNVFNFPYADDTTTIELPMPFGKASAGSGNYIFGEGADTKTIIVDNVTRKADFIMEVSGSSMLPDYEDGDLIAIRYMPDIAIGEIGVFELNGSRYIKQRGELGLISLNPQYDNIPVSEFDAAICLGKVIAKIEPESVVM